MRARAGWRIRRNGARARGFRTGRLGWE